MSALTGLSYLGFSRGRVGGRTWKAFDSALWNDIPEVFHSATAADVATTMKLAAQATPVLAALSGKAKAAFLRDLVTRIEAATPALAARAQQETSLPEARCLGEIGRTMSQLRLFADLVEKGDWLDARLELANPDRKPLPKPDHRSMCRPLGPVAVFCASNFPFAYSVAGGDTASALAGGNPVVVMAHHAHPGTAEIMGGLIVDAVRAAGLPEGTFSMLMGDGKDVGQLLAQHPALRAIGFTGSRTGGRALMDIAAEREIPIPVYAEMSSLNPVVLLEGALVSRGEAIATGLAASCTLGVGQFCTQPGLLLMVKTPTAEAFVGQLAAHFRNAPEGVMLTPAIQKAYVTVLAARETRGGIQSFSHGKGSGKPGRALPTLLAVGAKTFLSDRKLQAELFGPSSLIVWCDDLAQLSKVLESLEGNLTATLHGTDEEVIAHVALRAQLEALAGRVVVNGFPTGVEVSHAIVHGGPYPSLSDGRSTSVGSNAIYRFTRLVCYQNHPDAALPVELQNANPLGLSRLVNGVRSSDAVK